MSLSQWNAIKLDGMPPGCSGSVRTGGHNMRRIGAGAACLALLAGCTYSTQTATLASAASEVRTSERISGAAILDFDPQFDALTKDAEKNSFECSAHRYPSTIGPAVKNSIRKAFEAVFDSVDVTGNASSNPDAVLIRIRHEEYQPMVSFSMGWWSAKASARSEIVIRVSAERKGKEIMHPITISGEGSSMGVSGGCGKGAQALNQANEAALKRLMENLAYRVINNGDLKRAVQASTPLAPSVS